MSRQDRSWLSRLATRALMVATVIVSWLIFSTGTAGAAANGDGAEYNATGSLAFGISVLVVVVVGAVVLRTARRNRSS